MKEIAFHLIFMKATVFLSVLRLNVPQIRQKRDDELRHGRETEKWILIGWNAFTPDASAEWHSTIPGGEPGTK